MFERCERALYVSTLYKFLIKLNNSSFVSKKEESINESMNHLFIYPRYHVSSSELEDPNTYVNELKKSKKKQVVLESTVYRQQNARN